MLFSFGILAATLALEMRNTDEPSPKAVQDSTGETNPNKQRASDEFALASDWQRYGFAFASLSVSLVFLGLGFVLPNRFGY
jgi:hypothetical protein